MVDIFHQLVSQLLHCGLNVLGRLLFDLADRAGASPCGEPFVNAFRMENVKAANSTNRLSIFKFAHADHALS